MAGGEAGRSREMVRVMFFRKRGDRREAERWRGAAEVEEMKEA